MIVLMIQKKVKVKMNENTHPIVANIVNQKTLCLAVNADNSSEFLNDLRVNTANASLLSEQGRFDAFASAMASVFGTNSSGYDIQPYNQHGSTAIIPVHGALINRFNSCWGFVTGYGYIKNAIAHALQNDNVDKIVLDVNSNGGEAAGCFETADFIREACNVKPIHAVVDSRCYSAAYAIASACTTISATPSSGIGSIGVVAVHVSMEKMLDNSGYKVTFIQAGDKKTLGNPYKDLTDEQKLELQKSIDISYKNFVELVSNNRSMDKDAVIKTQAACYTANESVELGLIDDVTTVEQAFSKLNKKESNMTVEKTNQTASTTDNGANAERQRIQGILTCEAAMNQQALASHLAFNTTLSVDDATGILAAANVQSNVEKQESEKPSEANIVQEPERNMLAEAMAQIGAPNVGVDTGSITQANADMDNIAAFANSFSH